MDVSGPATSKGLSEYMMTQFARLRSTSQTTSRLFSAKVNAYFACLPTPDTNQRPR